MSMNSLSALRSIRVQWLAAILALAVLVAALWLPYKLNFAGFGDEWVDLARVENGTLHIGGTLRTFESIPYQIAYLLAPNSFVGMNILLAVMTFGRGLGIYALLRRLLPENPALALVAAGLASVYPGDISFYALVCINITTALVLFLTALVMLVAYWQQPRRYLILIMWLTLGLSIGIYEISYPLIAAAPLILVYLKRGIDRRVIRVSALWYAIPFAYALLNVIARLTTNSVANYQLSVIKPDNSLASVLRSFVDVYARAGQVWNWAALMPQGFSDGRVWLILVVAILWGIALWIHMVTVEHTVSVRRYIIILLGGLVAFGLGYSLYSLLNYGFSRTLFYALPWAAVSVSVAAWLLSRFQRIPSIIITLILFGIAIFYGAQTDRLSALLIALIGVGFLVKSNWRYVLIGSGVVAYAGAATMGYHVLDPYAALPARQQQIATAIATQAPAIQSGSLLLLTGDPATKEQYETFIYRSDVFQSIMQFLYQKYDFEAQMCTPDGQAISANSAICTFEDDAVVVKSLGQTQRWSYDRIIVFNYKEDKGAELLTQIPATWLTTSGAEAYNPTTLIDTTAPLPHRLQTMWTP